MGTQLKFTLDFGKCVFLLIDLIDTLISDAVI